MSIQEDILIGCRIAALIAEELGWDKKEIRNLKKAAHLHDIGKIGIRITF